MAAFGAWEAFPFILNEQRSKVPVVAAFEPTGGAKPTANEQLINRMLAQSFRPWGEHECLDVFTHRAAMEHLRCENQECSKLLMGRQMNLRMLASTSTT